MENLIHADIFFFVSTIAFSLISVVLIIAIIYIIAILNDVKKLSTKIRKEGEEILDDVHSFRATILRWILGKRRSSGK